MAPMIEITVGLPGGKKPLDTRRPIHEVVGLHDQGPSARGSTYYKSLLDCPREHGLLYQVGLNRTQKSDALNTGWLFHHALETYYKVIYEHQQALIRNARGAVRYDDIFFHGAESDAARAAWNAIKPVSAEPGFEDIWSETSNVVDHYFDRYAGVDRWEILAVEETLEYWGSCRKAFDFTTRLDMVIKDHADHRMWVVEHKTTKYLSKDLIDFYDLDLQICGQMWTLQKTVDLSKYPKLGGVRINIGTKHKESQFVRHEVLPSPAHLAAFEDAMMRWVRTRAFQQKEGWPKALGHCSGYARGYAQCQFYELCRGFPSAKVSDIAAWADAPKGFFFKDRV